MYRQFRIIFTIGILALLFSGKAIANTRCEKYVGEASIMLPLPDSLYTVSLTQDSICPGDTSEVILSGSQLMVRYQLQDSITKLPIGLPVFGTGGSIMIPTGKVYSTTTFQVLATDTTDSSTAILDNMVTLTVRYAATMGIIPSDTQACFGDSLAFYAVGTSLNFNAFNGKVSIPDNPALRLATEITVEAWVKASTFSIIPGSNPVVSKLNTGGGQVKGYALRVGENGKPEFVFSPSMSMSIYSAKDAALLSVGVWHHLVGTFDGQRAFIYVDGVKKDSSVGYVGNIVNGPAPLLIGASPTNSFRRFMGEIDEVRIWDVALNANQIQARMNQPLGGNETGLVVYYDFSFSSPGNILKDLGPNGLDGTLVYMNPSTGWWKPGVFALNSPITYAWNSGIGGTSTDSIPQFTYPAGTYQVSCKISDVNSCTQTDSVSIVAHPPFSVDLGPDTSVCGMSSLVLGGTLPTGGYAYLWSNTATSQTITVGAGTYTVTVTDTNLCTAIDTILVATGGAQTPFLGQDTLICPGDSLELDAGAGWASYLWSSMDTTQTISIDSAGTYYVDVVDSMNCMAVDSFVLAIDSIFTVDLGIDTIIVCSDSTILLDAGNFGPSKTYLWSTGATTQTISVTQPNTYLVTVTSSAMCEESDSVKFLNYLKNSFSLPGDTILCNGDTLDLDVSLAGLGFLWSTGATTPTLMVNMMGIFWVDVLDSNACWTRDSIAINYTAPPQVALSGLNSAYCGNDPVISLVGTPTGGTFYGPGVAGASFDPGQIIAPDTVLLIYGYAPANQCEGRDSLSVIIRPVPAVSLAGLGGSYCVADSIATLSGIPAGGTFSGPGIVAASFDPAQAGQGVHSIAYTFTDGQGCTGTTLANTQVFALPQVSISGLAAAYCETADPIMLNGVPTGGTFSGPGVVGAVFDPVIAGASAGHNIAYTYTDGNGCQGVAAITVAINVATGTADAGADQEIWLGNQTELAAVLPALGTGAWTIVQGTGELAGATDPHSTISGLQDGLTILEWTLTNGVCNTAGQMRIKKHPFEEKRGFSPNGDGLNDFFVIEGLERYPKSKMIIRSRWGETIWQAPNYANDWNGVNHAGEPFPDDTYFFELQVSNGTHYKGFVVLRR